MGRSKSKIFKDELKEFLDLKSDLYNSVEFIESDPIQVPHQFDDPRDIEIAAFLTATIAWGQKITIISNAKKLISWMPGGPHEFLISADEDDLSVFFPFVHRTFNGVDCIYFLGALKRIYSEEGSLQDLFEGAFRRHGDIAEAIKEFRKIFFQYADPGRTAKHIPDLANNASAKRINMFLRWMVRRDTKGVDFGIWTGIPMEALYIPLDVHTGRVARKLQLLERKQNDWKAVVELTRKLQELDRNDPIRYDYALFGLGSFEKF